MSSSNPFDRFRGGGDLAAFFRSLATPSHRFSTSTTSSSNDYEWDTTRSTGRLKLEFFDQGLNGAAVVLKALEENPHATSITLAQNELRDAGLLAFLMGLKRLRHQGIGGHLQELNLSGCRLTDTSLHLLALHCLSASPHPPSIAQLYLSGNDFSLSSPALSAFLGSALSSPASSLRCLTLTSNPSLGTTAVVSLLQHLRLSPGTSLAQLHLSVCGLAPDVAEPLARWLEDPEGGGSRLQVLCLNGNKIGSAGLRRIARSVGKACTGLLHLEMFANEDEDEEELDPLRWREVEKALEEQESEEDVEGWKERLEIAKGRNKTVFRETRLAALGLLARARVLFAGNPREADVDVEAIRRQVETLSNPDQSPSPPSLRPFPFLSLPIEIQVHVLRCSVLLSPSSTAHLYSPPTSNPPTSSSPLTEPQFLRVLSHAADRTTLAREANLLRAQLAGTVPSIAPKLDTWEYKDGRSLGVVDREEAVWEEWMLKSTGCDRFERG